MACKEPPDRQPHAASERLDRRKTHQTRSEIREALERLNRVRTLTQRTAEAQIENPCRTRVHPLMHNSITPLSLPLVPQNDVQRLLANVTIPTCEKSAPSNRATHE